MRTIDRRTRFDSHVRSVDPDSFFGEELPALLERHGRLAAEGLRYLDLPPLTIDVEGFRRTLGLEGDRLSVTSGEVDGSVTVHLDAELFSDLAQQLRSFNAMVIGGRIPLDRNYGALSGWDSVWIALLEGWPVVDHGLAFTDRAGEPLDLRRSFTPDDDPADIAHFLHEAGFVHLRGWVDTATMDVIAEDIRRALPTYEKGDGRSWWATLADGTERCVRLQHFVDHSPATVEMLTSDRWKQLREALQGDDQLVQAPVEGNCIEALVKPLAVASGISDVPWHRDCNFGRHAYGCSSTTVGVSVTAGSPVSGQLRVVAGSHRVAMPSTWADERSYLPVVPLPTEAGDLTVHLSCTLHEAQPPLEEERMVMYTGFHLAPRPGDVTGGGKALSELRERAPLTSSQEPSPLARR